MTRAEHLVFCKKCINRKMDLKQGLICNITGEKADFDPECKNFIRDEDVPDELIPAGADALSPEDIDSLPQEVIDKLIAEQKMAPGLIVGALVGIVGAIIWAAISIATEYQIGYLALAIGAGVGYSIRLVGKGIQPIFGIWGAVIALLSVLLGNILTTLGFVGIYMEMDFFTLLQNLDFSHLPEMMIETFSPIDLLFYGIATYEGYKFSFRVIDQESLKGIN